MHIAEQRRRTLLKDFHDTWSSIATAKHQHLPPLFTSFLFLPRPPPFASFHGPSFGAVISDPFFSLPYTRSFASSYLSFPPLTPIMLQGHRMARLYLPSLFSFSLHLMYIFWLQSITSNVVTPVAAIQIWSLGEIVRSENSRYSLISHQTSRDWHEQLKATCCLLKRV